MGGSSARVIQDVCCVLKPKPLLLINKGLVRELFFPKPRGLALELGQTERQQSWPAKAKRAKKKGNNGRQNSIPAPAMECSWKSDNVLGPIVSSCRGGFDFTLLFEQAIFSTIPSILLLIACAWRLRRIYRWPQKTASSFSTALKYCKQVWEGTYIPQEFFLTLFTDRFLFGAFWPHSWPLLFCGRHLNFTRPEYRWRHQHYL